MKKLWGGAHREVPNQFAEHFGNSLHNDLTFWLEDVRGSIAHARMLGEQGIITKSEARKLIKGLEQLYKSVDFKIEGEDVHTLVELRLADLVGDVAGKLHTARSRNDQVATDARLYAREEVRGIQINLKPLQGVLIERAEEHAKTIMPGMTHQQHAQPITLGFHLLAHFWALQRHGWRFEALWSAANYSPLGAAALAGTSFPIDRKQTASELGFTAPIPNALDATSDRSFVLDLLHACATTMVDLSRLSQELVLWSTPEFGWVTLPDSLTTGSSIMPQKRNPDYAELIRGRSSRAIANYVQVATMLKGLVLGYNRDSQDDKPPLFDSLRLTTESLYLMQLMVKGATFNTDRMAQATKGDFSTATDLADFLAKSGMPFRQAHEQVGKVVRACMDSGIGLEDLTPKLLKEIAPKIPADALKVLSPEASIKSRESEGGTGPKSVARQLRQAKTLLKAEGFKRPY
jgi:argininosuccinate lyase